MKKVLLTALVAFVIVFTTFAQSKGEDIKGVWTNEQKSIRIEFFEAKSGYAAKIVWQDESKNENSKSGGKSFVGTTIIYNLKFDGNKYVSGKILAPRKGITADCSIKMISQDKIEITGKKGFYNDTKIWTRCK